MRVYHYKYIVQSSFVPQVDWHFFKLRAVPCENAFQQVYGNSLVVSPNCRLSCSVDGYGNIVQWGSFDYPHRSFTMVSEGDVHLIHQYSIKEKPAPFYLASTGLTTCDEEMREKAFELGSPEEIMHFVHDSVTYSPGTTTIATTAYDVFHNRRGVCQDLAHLMIAMCRAIGIHARYVNGLIIGEGQTHAWVEVSNGKVWYAYDPTHDKKVRWDYIKIAHGRDADDCPTNRGRFYSWTNETMTVVCTLTKEIIK